MMTLATSVPFKLLGEYVRFEFGFYENGRTAITIICDDGDQFGVLTTNLSDQPQGEGEIFVKTWSENAVLREPILALGIFEDTGKRVPTGFVEAEVWRFI